MKKHYILIEHYQGELSKDVCLELEDTELNVVETLETNSEINSFMEVAEIVESYLKDYNIHSVVEKLYSDIGNTKEEVRYKINK